MSPRYWLIVTVPIESWQVWWVMLGRLCVTQASDLPRHTLLTNSDKRIFTTSEGFTVTRFGHRRAFMARKVAPHKYSNSQAPIFTWSMEAIKNEDRFYYSVRKSWRNKRTEINTHTDSVNTHRPYMSPVSAHPFSALSVFTHLQSDILSQPSPVHPVAFPPPFQHRHAFIFFKHCAFLQVWPVWAFCLELFFSSFVTVHEPIRHCSSIV